VKIASVSTVPSFVTKDGSMIRELHHTKHQSLAEASLEPGQSTVRHRHLEAEEIYVVLEGLGSLGLGDESRQVGPGDSVLIPPGAPHQIRAETALRFLCCCWPPYADDDTVLG
jgi:mannose-6-phosphate isomerase-like protein (cupin superfamily)